MTDAIEPTRLPLGEVNLVDRGADPALLLLHGNGRTWEDWRLQFQTLTDRLRLITYDQRGFGELTVNGCSRSSSSPTMPLSFLNQLGVKHAYIAAARAAARRRLDSRPVSPTSGPPTAGPVE